MSHAHSTSGGAVGEPAGVLHRPIESDRALGDVEICGILGISKPTLHRYRKVHGLPGPHFRCGQRTFTWRSQLNEWIAQREAAGVEFHPAMNQKRREAAAAAASE
jgi:predicted DNA-binding transcriptional regulator AlpA